MPGVSRERLNELYAVTDDPWNFRSSTYEHRKFAETLDALAQKHYREVLEVGCSNGELGRRLAHRSGRYVGLDAAPRALASARRTVPDGEFHEGFLPCDLPAGQFELIVVSELLYFLDTNGIAALAQQIATRWPDAELITVTFRGPTGNDLQGEEALRHWLQCLPSGYVHLASRVQPEYRIDRHWKSYKEDKHD